MRRRKLTCPPCFGGMPSAQAGQTAKSYLDELDTACPGYRGSRCYVVVPSSGDGREIDRWRERPFRLISTTGPAERCRAICHAGWPGSLLLLLLADSCCCRGMRGIGVKPAWVEQVVGRDADMRQAEVFAMQ